MGLGEHMFERRQALAALASGLEGDVSGELARWMAGQDGLAAGLARMYGEDSDDRARVRVIRSLSAVSSVLLRADGDNAAVRSAWLEGLLAVVGGAAADRREWRHRLEAGRALASGRLLAGACGGARTENGRAWEVAALLLADEDD